VGAREVEGEGKKGKKEKKCVVVKRLEVGEGGIKKAVEELWKKMGVGAEMEEI